MADDNQQEGLSAQERLARLYSSLVDDQQGDAVPTAGQVTGVRVSAGAPQAQASSARERLDRLRARRAGVPLPGDPEAATPVNNEGANRPRFNINLSRIVDAIPTIVRYFPLRIFTVWGLCSVWYRMYLNVGGDDVLHTGLPAPGYSAFNPFALGAVVFIGLLVVVTEIIAGPLSLIIKQLIIGATYFLRGSAATREARDRAHANFSLRQLVTETVRGYHSGYSVFGSMARAARGARNGASTLDYGVGAFTGEDPNAPVYDDGLGDRPSQMELTDDAASRIWDLYYPAYGAEGPMSNLHEALAAGAAVVGTGRSDFMNQINNVLAFPGIFRGALDVRAGEINDEMKTAASFALAELVADDELSREYILPKAFDKRIAGAVAAAVAKAARETGVSRI